MQKQTVRLIEFHNRHIDVLLKSGTVIPNVAVTGTEVFDDNREKLPSPQIKGVDRYSNQVVIDTDNIEAFAFLDTDEQARLRNVIFMVDTYGQIPNLEVISPDLKKAYDDSVAMKEELEEKGITLYVPVREDV